MDSSEMPTTNPKVVLIVVIALAAITLTGLLGTIYLCHTNTDPVLVSTAAKMIQTDPSSAMAALMLLRADAAIIAIVSGLTGVALGQLGGVLSSSRTQKVNGEPKVLTKTETMTTATTTSAPSAEPKPSGKIVVPEQKLETIT